MTQLLYLLFVCGMALLPFSQLPFSNGTRPVSWAFWFIPIVLVCFVRLIRGTISWKELPFFVILLTLTLYLFITPFLMESSVNFILLYVGRVVAIVAGFGVYFLVITRFGGIVSPNILKRAYIIVFLPITAYGLLVQIPAVLGVSWCLYLNVRIRSLLTYFSIDIGRLSWFASEPSFAAFQIASVIGVLLLFNKRQLWHNIYILMLILSLLFTKSIYGMILLTPLVPLGLFVCLRTLRGKLIIITVIVLLPIVIFTSLRSTVSLPISRIENIKRDPSAIHRYLLLKSTIVAGLKTFGVGVGVGQYQNRWREFIDSQGSLFPYATPALKGKFNRSIPGDYKPYSVIGGMWAELGVMGLFAIILPFFMVIKDVMTSSMPTMVRYELYCVLSFVFLSFIGAYPISMPHMWFLLALANLESGKYCVMGGRGVRVVPQVS